MQAIPHHLGITKHSIIVRHNLLGHDQSDLTGLFPVPQPRNLQNNSYDSPLRYRSLLITMDWARRGERIKHLLSTTTAPPCVFLGLQPGGGGSPHHPLAAARPAGCPVRIPLTSHTQPPAESKGKLRGQGEAGGGLAARPARSRRRARRSWPGSVLGARPQPPPDRAGRPPRRGLSHPLAFGSKGPATSTFWLSPSPPPRTSCVLKVYPPFAPSPDLAFNAVP